MANAELERYLMGKYKGDEEMQAAQDEANRRRLAAGLGGASAKLGAAIAGSNQPVDTSFYQRQAAESGRKPKELQQRRKELAAYLDKKQGKELELAKLDSDKSYKDKQLALAEERNALAKTKQAQDSQFKLAQLDAKEKADQLKATDKKDKLSPKQKEKRGLASIGEKAERQYMEAVNRGLKSGGFDPTSATEMIDTSRSAPSWMKNKDAVAAMAAADSWIDSYLRDESGAAIPDAERAAYYRIYFPQPGENDPTTIANKAVLRREKMNNARSFGDMEALAEDSFPAWYQKSDSGTAMAGTGSGFLGQSGESLNKKVDDMEMDDVKAELKARGLL